MEMEVRTDMQALGKWRTHSCAPSLPRHREVVDSVWSRWPRLYTRPQCAGEGFSLAAVGGPLTEDCCVLEVRVGRVSWGEGGAPPFRH